jgi:8-oxo-dGTP diphosphatase
VLLVHRPRYDDWSFPKGGVEEGETLEEAALREVEEESGVESRIIRKLPQVRYTYETRSGKARPKVVHYFLMEAVGGSPHATGEEADAVEWLDLDEAETRLSYEHDKNLLRSLLSKRL